MKTCKFAELTEANKSIVKAQLEKFATNVNYDDVVVVPQDDNKSFFIEYGDLKIAVPIKEPDQGTSNGIWQTLIGGVIVIAAVGVTLVCSKKKSW